MRGFAALLALGTACATMNTQQMPPRCREQYNFCLNGCRGKPMGGPSAQAGTPEYEMQMRTNSHWQNPAQPDMSCAGRCDRDAEACTLPAGRNQT